MNTYSNVRLGLDDPIVIKDKEINRLKKILSFIMINTEGFHDKELNSIYHMARGALDYPSKEKLLEMSKYSE